LAVLLSCANDLGYLVHGGGTPAEEGVDAAAEPGDSASSDLPGDLHDAGVVEAAALDVGAMDAAAAPISDAAPPKPRGPAPAIFYVAHQHDEYLGMSLAIPEHIAAGRPVKVVLYTRGTNATLRDYYRGSNDQGQTVDCPLAGTGLREPGAGSHPTHHAFDVDNQWIENTRTAEFERSVRAMGVTDIVETGWDDTIASTYGAPGDPFIAQLKALILKYEQEYPGSSHKCISGIRDCGSDGSAPHPAHVACWYAAKELWAEYPKGVTGTGSWDFRFYDIGFYGSSDASTYNARGQSHYALSQFMSKKQASYYEYHHWDPNAGYYAVGYHSGSILFDNAASDSEVHIEIMSSAPDNYKCPKQP
jgi:LmbE family N-acetylglucosaminyl deacetylase